MARETITIRLESEKKEALDELARLLDRDRTYLINEAIDRYLEVQHWHLEHIDKAIAQADSGEFATEAEVSEAFERLRELP
ncbi:CopG family ribbon-helix-helix protein [Gloeobacter violaceus]|uniref:Gsr3527 protein n=1 Tax=Gloeobacter violaceus (strain ATCC 29082 / PCC 7421) TaxID=251221 RepID=Q7NFJ8_GLOVI|nr:ribbon-helix-helix protein, CopG family [Gloeobacter violaceus]BAC91468.1 gsr3527 [Gloeobacter violaceus PCC 7421]